LLIVKYAKKGYQMLGEILLGLLTSFIYDSIKKGAKLTYNLFSDKIKKEAGNIPKSDIDELYRLYVAQTVALANKFDSRLDTIENLIYSIRNQLMNEINQGRYQINIQLNDIDHEKLQQIVYSYIDDINATQNKMNSRKYDLHVEKGDDYFDDKNYDSAQKEYQAARKYISNETEEYTLLWNIFLCYLNIKNYYVALYEINNKVIDLQLLINNSDGNLSRAASSLRYQAGITNSQAYDILNCAVNGAQKYEHLRKYAISKKGYDIGLRAISIAKKHINISHMQQIYDNLYYFE